MHSNLKAIIWMLIHVFSYSLLAINYRILSENIHPIYLSLFLDSCGLLALFPFILYKYKDVLKSHFWHIHLIRAACTLVGQIALVYAYNNMEFAQVSAITLTYPLMCTVGAIIFLGEKVKFSGVITLFFGFFGALIIINPNYNDFNYYSIYALLAMIPWVIFDLLTRKYSKSEPVLTQLFYIFSFLVLLSAVPASMVKSSINLQHLALKIPYIGIIVILYYLSNIFAVIDARGLNVVLPFYFLTLVLSSVIGYYLFQEIICPSTMLGSLMVLGSTSYISYKEYKTKNFKKIQKEVVVI